MAREVARQAARTGGAERQVPTMPGPPVTLGSSHLLCRHQPHWVRAHPGHTLPLRHLFKGPLQLRTVTAGDGVSEP